MNRIQVKGAAKEAIGKIQRLAGKLLGSPKRRVKAARSSTKRAPRAKRAGVR